MAHKDEVITFKVAADLAERIRHLPNRSEFIRVAVLSALDNVCPVCQGSGVLESTQRKHFEEFLRSHHIERCPDCTGVHLVCDHEPEAEGHVHSH